ncbi:histidine kinase [Anaerolineales bacterium HSG25]|nr:histidine kinase [Anaerolineales bacterium HSG25]
MMEPKTTGRSDIVVALRNFSYVWLILSVISLMSIWFFSNAELESTRRIYTVVLAALWALYLSLPKLEQRLGATYLPIALGIAVFGLFIVQIVSVWSGFRPENEAPLDRVFNMVAFMSISTVITLIVGWKYHLRQVIIVSLVYSVLIAASLTFSVTHRPEHFVVAIIVISLFIATSLGAVGYFVWHLSQMEQFQREQLTVANRQLRRQAIQREELTISRERNRLARELHDTLAHSLSGVTVQIEATRALWSSNPEAAEVMLSRADDMARTGLTEARRALQSLRATPLQDLGLGLALQAMGEEVAARAGATLNTELPPHLATNLDSHVEQNLYRIA